MKAGTFKFALLFYNRAKQLCKSEESTDRTQIEAAVLIINNKTDVIVCDEWVAISIHSTQHDTRLEKRTYSMKTIGLIGGMSWESTVTYYQIINEIVKKELGGLHSAKCILYSVDFDEIERCQSAGAWEKSGEILGKAAESLEAAGADFILICTNTMHKVFEQVQRYVNIPFIHIAQATADVLKRENITRVGLLGTKYTMEQDFYKGKLAENGISVVIPDADDIETVNSIIFHELCIGKIEDKSRKKYLEIIDKMSAKGVQGVILGCTEIGLLIHQEDTYVKLFDTTQIHGEAAAYMSLDRL